LAIGTVLIFIDSYLKSRGVFGFNLDRDRLEEPGGSRGEACNSLEFCFDVGYMEIGFSFTARQKSADQFTTVAIEGFRFVRRLRI